MNENIVELLKKQPEESDPGTEAYLFACQVGAQLRRIDPPSGLNAQSRSRQAYLNGLERALPHWAADPKRFGWKPREFDEARDAGA